MRKSPDAFRTISEVAQELDLPQHVLRFWETRFSQIKPMKRGGGRRYYRPDDVELLRGIRHLLYSEGYTIKGVQRILKEQGVRHVIDVTSEPQIVGAQTAGQAVGSHPVVSQPADPSHLEVERPALVPAPQTTTQPASQPLTHAAQPQSQPTALPRQPALHPQVVQNSPAPNPSSPAPAAQTSQPTHQPVHQTQATPQSAPVVPPLPPEAQTVSPSQTSAAPHNSQMQPGINNSVDSSATDNTAPVSDHAIGPALPAGLSQGEPLYTKGESATVSVASGQALIQEENRSTFFSRLRGKASDTHAQNSVVEPAVEIGLSRDDVRRLQLTLFEMLECKRILDQARGSGK